MKCSRCGSKSIITEPVWKGKRLVAIYCILCGRNKDSYYDKEEYRELIK